MFIDPPYAHVIFNELMSVLSLSALTSKVPLVVQSFCQTSMTTQQKQVTLLPCPMTLVRLWCLILV